MTPSSEPPLGSFKGIHTNKVASQARGGRASHPTRPSFASRMMTLGGTLTVLWLITASSASEALADPKLAVGALPNRVEEKHLLAPSPDPASPSSGAPNVSEWRLIDGRHWQHLSESVEDAAVTDAREGNRGACPSGMVEVEGAMKTHPTHSIDGLQLMACTKWISREFPERCAVYDREKWLALSKSLPTKDQHFCIDRFEYPNQKGAFPYVMVTYLESRDLCQAQGKRLCTEEEWTFACEGEEARPYPTGYTRDAAQCVIDESWDSPKEGALLPRDTERAGEEIARIFHGAPSGSARSCKSPFGVYDMTGNVDEWTRSSLAGERPSILKGGYFGPVRTRCRPATRAHNEWHMYYQEGFRCCSDVP